MNTLVWFQYTSVQCFGTKDLLIRLKGTDISICMQLFKCSALIHKAEPIISHRYCTTEQKTVALSGGGSVMEHLTVVVISPCHHHHRTIRKMVTLSGGGSVMEHLTVVVISPCHHHHRTIYCDQDCYMHARWCMSIMPKYCHSKSSCYIFALLLAWSLAWLQQ